MTQLKLLLLLMCFIILSDGVYAVTEGHGITIDGTQSYAGATGLLISPTGDYDLYVTAVTKSNSEAGTRVYFYNASNKALLYDSTGFSSNVHSFVSPLILYRENSYWLLNSHPSCSSRTNANKVDTYPVPINVSGELTWITAMGLSTCGDSSTNFSTMGDIYSYHSLTFTPLVNSSLNIGIKAFYDFETNGSNSVGNFNNLNPTGAVTHPTGKIGNGARLDRLRYYNTTSLSGFVGGASPWTYNTWINIAQMCTGTTGGGDCPFMSIGTTESVNQQTRIGLCKSDQICINNYEAISSGITIPTLNVSQWYMFTVMYDGTKIVSYVDGVNHGNATKTMNLNANAFMVGYSRSANAGLNGTYDLAGYWNRTLLYSEITELYNDFQGNNYPFGVVEPVNIETINFTSDAPPHIECVLGQQCANTSDTTPSFTVTTNVDAKCRIATTNLSYASMTTNCTPDDSFTTSHSCTIASPLDDGDSDIFFACEGESESNVSVSIGIGIQTMARIVLSPGIGAVRFNPLLTGATYAFVRNGSGVIGITNITSLDNPAVNQTNVTPLFTVDSSISPNSQANITGRVHDTAGGFAQVKCANNSVSTTATILNDTIQRFTIFPANSTGGIWCWMDYINATNQFNFTLTFDEEQE